MKYYKNTIHTSFEEEKIKFNEFLSKNPKQGIPYDKSEYFISGNKTSKYNLFSWISGELNDKFITSQFLERELNKYGYNVQLYFDIVCLGLTSIYDRPKCVICNSTSDFISLFLGYSKTCSTKCREEYKHQYTSDIGKRSKSEETRQKLRLSHLGKTLSDDVRRKVSEGNKGKHKITPEQRKILVSRRKELGGYKVSQETRTKISLSNRGKKKNISEEGLIAKRNAIKNRKYTPTVETREKLSKSLKGKKHNLSKESRDKLILFNKTRVRSKEESEKKSLEMINRINNGFAPMNHFKKGNYYSNVFGRKFFFDSSWEEKFIKLLEQKFISSEILFVDRCRVPIIYNLDDGSTHRYLPDFVIKFKNNITVVIEIKPANLLRTNRVVYLKKMAALKEYKKNNIKYIILTENELFKNINGSFNIFDYIV